MSQYGATFRYSRCYGVTISPVAMSLLSQWAAVVTMVVTVGENERALLSRRNMLTVRTLPCVVTL